MNELTILIDQDQKALLPGALLGGTVRWQLENAPSSLRLQLMWFTSGKGGTDVQLVDTLDFNPRQSSGVEPFQFTLPDSPYSFSGKLISLHWALELIAQPNSLNSRIEFVLSPSEKEINLPQVEKPKTDSIFGQFKSARIST